MAEKPLGTFDTATISELFRGLRVQSTVLCRTDFRSPWGFAVKESRSSAFHLVTSGRCWLNVDGLREWTQLEAGTIVLLMTGRGHRLSDAPSSEVPWLDDILRTNPPIDGHLSHGGSGAEASLVCGSIALEGLQAHPLLLSLPPMLRLDPESGDGAGWLPAVQGMIEVELEAAKPGLDAMLARLADVLIAEAMREFLLSLAESDGAYFAGLRDARIAKAIRLFQTDPARDWTVEIVSREVAMSRSSFAGLFREVTGESPIRYLTRCRLARAASLLVNTDATVFSISQEVGYDSEASLAKAFSRAFGTPPGAYRRQVRAGSGELTDVLPQIEFQGSYPTG